MKQILRDLGTGIAYVVFTMKSFMRYRQWRDLATTQVIGEERELNIEMGAYRFRERVFEVITEIAQVEADMIETRWHKRLGVAGES